MKIITDSSTLYTPEQGKEFNLVVLPLSVSIDGKTYTEFVDIDSKTFLEKVKAGSIPTSSQPPIGKSMEVFDSIDDEMLVISMADGLSGTYQSMEGAKNISKNNSHIHVMNTKTLCGPHRYLVQKAMRLRDEGIQLETIMNEIQKGIEKNGSFLIASDFDFLKRGGRLTPLAASIAGLLKITPVVVQSPDGKRLEKFAVKRTFKAAINCIVDELEKLGIDETYKVYCAHADILEYATYAKETINARFNLKDTEILDLSPAFITQGGPGCLAIQYIKR